MAPMTEHLPPSHAASIPDRPSLDGLEEKLHNPKAKVVYDIFAAKGERVVEMNLKAFEIGREYGGRQ